MAKLMGLKKWKKAMTEQAFRGSRPLKIRGYDAPYTDVGSGSVVLHVHGSPGGCDAGPFGFGDLIKAGYRIVTPSRPGFMGAPLELGRTPEEQGDYIASFMDAVNINKAAVLAWSGGGPPGLQLAIRHPEKVACYIHFAACSLPFKHKATFFERAFMTDPGLWFLYVMASLFPSANKKMCSDLGVNPDYALASPERIVFMRKFMTMIAPASLRAPGSWNDVAQYYDLPKQAVEKIKSPTLVVHSDTDREVTMANAEFVAKNVPNAEFFKFAKGGHVPQLDEDWDKVLDATVSFLKRHNT